MKQHLSQILFFVFLVYSGFVSAEILDSTRNYFMDEVVIQSSRLGNKMKNIPQKVEIITKKDIQEVPNENLSEVIKRLTNLDVVQYPGASSSVGMRGFSPCAHSRSYTLILINGKPAGTTNLASLIPSDIERIEVIKGPYATLYGSDAMGGVINIITETINNVFKGNVSLEGGNFGFYRFDGTVSGKILPGLRGGFGISSMKQGKDYLIGKSNLLKISDLEKLMIDNNSYGDTMNHSKYDLSCVNTRIEWDICNLWSANAEVTYTFGNDIETPGNYWGSYGYSKKQIKRVNAYANIERKNDKGVLSFSPYFTKEDEPDYSDISSEGFVSFKSDISEYGFQLQQQNSFLFLKTVCGIDFGVNDYHSERFEFSGTPASPYKPDNRNSNGALFGQLSYSSDHIDINAGVRFDHFISHVEANEILHSVASDNSYNSFNPSIGVQYRLLDNLKVHSSFGTAFSVPDAFKTAGSFDVYVYYPEWNYTWKQSYVGNPDLKPERSGTIDMGVGFFTQNRAFHGDITFFHTRHIDKIIDSYIDDVTKTYINANGSVMDGLEFSADYDIGSLFNERFSLSLYSNWTWLFNSYYSNTATSITGTDSTYYRDQLYVRKLNGNFGISYRDKNGFSARLNGRYEGFRLEDDSFGLLRPGIKESDYTTDGGYTASEKILKYPDFIVLDFSARYTLKTKLSFGLNISNLMDENYTEKDGYNMQGRQIKFNIGYQF
jgi:vitamin B12 transporter